MRHAFPSNGPGVSAETPQRIATAAPWSNPRPLTAPAETAAARMEICQRCEHNSGGNCRLFACCTKDLAKTVAMALQKCPVNKWPTWLTPPP